MRIESLYLGQTKELPMQGCNTSKGWPNLKSFISVAPESPMQGWAISTG